MFLKLASLALITFVVPWLLWGLGILTGRDNIAKPFAYATVGAVIFWVAAASFGFIGWAWFFQT